MGGRQRVEKVAKGEVEEALTEGKELFTNNCFVERGCWKTPSMYCCDDVQRRGAEKVCGVLVCGRGGVVQYSNLYIYIYSATWQF